MTQETVLGPLDGNTLKELARVICGDDHLFYRRGFEIAQFLENAGWRNVPEYDGEYRGEWALQLLTERRESPTELEKVLLRLADAREYLEEPGVLPTVVDAVNTFLVHEGFRLENPGGRPRVVACDPTMAHPGQQASVELKATMAEIIREPRMAALLQRRLDEAHTCYANGAHVAAIIMLGSLLEGVLLTVIEERDASLLGKRTPISSVSSLSSTSATRRAGSTSTWSASVRPSASTAISSTHGVSSARRTRPTATRSQCPGMS